MSVAIGYGPNGRITSQASSDLKEDPEYKLMGLGGDLLASTRRDAREFPGLGVMVRETIKMRHQNNPTLSTCLCWVPNATLRKSEDGSFWEMYPVGAPETKPTPTRAQPLTQKN